MEILVVVIALLVGYVIGILQKGIHIHTANEEVPKEYNQSVGLNEEVKQYYEQTGGINKF